MNGRLWIALLAVVLVACAGPKDEAVFSSEVAPAVAPAIPSALLPDVGSAPFTYGGLDPLEVSILSAEVIVRASYVSSQASVVQVSHPPPFSYNDWTALLTFRFRVHEYLKGSGPNEIDGVVYIEFDEEADARTAMAAMSAAHDSRWDDREAIVFLRTDLDDLIDHHELSAGQYWLGRMVETTSEIGAADAYTVASRYRKLWLPEAASNGLPERARSSSEKYYLLEAPPISADGRGSAAGESSFASSQSAPSTPTIGLGALKSRIAALEAEANVGGTPEYHTCVEMSYKYQARVQYQIDLRGQPPLVRLSNIVGSGRPAGIPVYDKRGSGRSMDKISAARFEGPDKDLFRFVNVDFSTSTTPHYEVRLTHRGVTARPLPAGEYVVYPNYIWYGGVVCDRNPENARRYWMLSVTAKSSHTNMIHEAFFDPVDIGAAVGADSTNGVLDPADFSLDGTTTTISNLKWQAGTVTMTLSPSASLAGYAVDFIALDGSVTSTLAFDDATQSGGTLTWSVANQPWHAGDKLMLRIRTAAPAPAIAISGLDASIEAGRSDAFTVSASNMATTTSYSIRVTTDDPDIGFDATCADRQEDTTVPAASASHSAAFTLRACSATGGTVTATLLEGTTAVATATQDVTVTAPPPPPPHAPAPTGLSVASSTETSLSVSWNTVQDAHRYKLERSADGSSGWSSVDDGISGTSHTLSGLSCATTVHFRVSARGDGSPYSTTFGSPSTSVSGTTGDCPPTPVATPTPPPTAPSPPAFASSTYSFTVAENASAFHVVGTVSADDPDGGVVTYSIVAGNGEGKFNITHNAGEIVVRRSLDHGTTSSYALTVRATDSSGATATAVVNITVTEAP